jgi:hypothetical protein
VIKCLGLPESFGSPMASNLGKPPIDSDPGSAFGNKVPEGFREEQNLQAIFLDLTVFRFGTRRLGLPLQSGRASPRCQ